VKKKCNPFCNFSQKKPQKPPTCKKNLSVVIIWLIFVFSKNFTYGGDLMASISSLTNEAIHLGKTALTAVGNGVLWLGRNIAYGVKTSYNFLAPYLLATGRILFTWRVAAFSLAVGATVFCFQLARSKELSAPVADASGNVAEDTHFYQRNGLYAASALCAVVAVATLFVL
jgi:hypothetical protein